MQFDFSAIIPIEIVKEVKPKGKTATPKNPEGMSLRIFKDGSIFPSQLLVDTFHLEYLNKGKVFVDNDREYDGPAACGFDIWSSADWGQYPKEAQQCVFIAAVPKSEPKVSVFGSVDYNADGTPIKSVLTQGAKRPELVEMLREVYDKQVLPGVVEDEAPIDELFGSKNYVDLDILTETVVFAGLETAYIPKTIVKGAKAGQMSYETRKNLAIFPLVISQVVEEVVEQVEVLEEVNN